MGNKEKTPLRDSTTGIILPLALMLNAVLWALFSIITRGVLWLYYGDIKEVWTR